jgi:hypothetical protein
MILRARRILWLDGGAAGAAGVAVLVLRHGLAELHALPLDLVVFMGASNLAYGCYSSALAVLASSGRAPGRRAIDVLIAANSIWAGVCGALLAANWHSASVSGLTHVGLEGTFVGSLALLERRIVRPLTR